ncbi:hypothetical protein MTO96_026567 [Rhipicephalus appendiculatus]
MDKQREKRCRRDGSVEENLSLRLAPPYPPSSSSQSHPSQASPRTPDWRSTGTSHRQYPRHPIALTAGPQRKRGPETNRQPSRESQLPRSRSHKGVATWTCQG